MPIHPTSSPFARTLAVLSLAAITSACATSGVVPRPFPMPGGDREPSSNAPAPAPAPLPAAPELDTNLPTPAPSVVEAALALRGRPYKPGGSTLKGFDCSGFTQYVFNQNGVRLPRATQDQFRVGRKVSPSDIEPGDLVFFKTTSRAVSHVGIAIGEGKFVHAPNSRGVVRVDSLSAVYWKKRFAGAHRVAVPAVSLAGQ